ncbi:hypothetical protein ACLOJK_020685 [Asimina triloba]
MDRQGPLPEAVVRNRMGNNPGMAEPCMKVSAASARAHTRTKQSESNFSGVPPPPHIPSSLFITCHGVQSLPYNYLAIAIAIVMTLPSSVRNLKGHGNNFSARGKVSVILFVGLMALVYRGIQPPPSNICGSPSGPPITAPRVKLSDGRHLAYKEHGVPRDEAIYKIVYVHGFDSCRHDALPLSQANRYVEFAYALALAFQTSQVYVMLGSIGSTNEQDVAEELGIYMVSFDRPGYGESDPHPTRTPKSIALDVEELADQLKLGSKFYVIGFSMGGQVVWGCLKYIPHRYAVTNFLLSPLLCQFLLEYCMLLDPWMLICCF